MIVIVNDIIGSYWKYDPVEVQGYLCVRKKVQSDSRDNHIALRTKHRVLIMYTLSTRNQGRKYQRRSVNQGLGVWGESIKF